VSRCVTSVHGGSGLGGLLLTGHAGAIGPSGRVRSSVRGGSGDGDRVGLGVAGRGLGGVLAVLDVVLEGDLEHRDARIALDVDAQGLHLIELLGHAREDLDQHLRGLLDELALRELHRFDHALLDQVLEHGGQLLHDRLAEAGLAEGVIDVVKQHDARDEQDCPFLGEGLLEVDHPRIEAADADHDLVDDARIDGAAEGHLALERGGQQALLPRPAHRLLGSEPALVDPREHLLQLALAALGEGGVHEGELDLVADGLRDPGGLRGDVDHRGLVRIRDLDASHEDGGELLLDDLIVERELDGPLPRVDVAGLGRGLDHVPHQGNLERLVTEHRTEDERRPEGLERSVHLFVPILNRQRVDSRRFNHRKLDFHRRRN
jgi:hypothetical protein